MRRASYAMAALAALLALPAAMGQPGKPAPPRVLAFWSSTVEGDHVEFAREALEFYQRAAAGRWQLESTSNWDDLNAGRLEGVKAVLWLNDSPHSAAQREAFEKYMEQGGGWIGFHGAAYNDSGTRWPWFVQFLGGAVFYGNNWPPLPGWLVVDDASHPVTKGLPKRILSPDSEWYSWRPSPRENANVKVLLTLEPANFPIGLKDTIAGGDVPVAWTNTKYRMVYFNMGHGDKILTNSIQNRLFEDALVWLTKQP